MDLEWAGEMRKFGARVNRAKSRARIRVSLEYKSYLDTLMHLAEMGIPNIWNSHPKTYGPASRTCRVCGNSHGLIRKYGLGKRLSDLSDVYDVNSVGNLLFLMVC
ncbi:hypothetical protein Leryth_016024 [Lithospermum erythrorhizon]|nr:hypothetical protein Leryth_016024 [Lithospermum erythrorhizon]